MARFVEVYRDLLYSLRFPTLGNVALPRRRARRSSLADRADGVPPLEGRLAEEL